ncbi:MAG TPA: NIL domain-containing protein [Acidimicrobiales bacterium]|nr:NIL domain-containing protein [Acidimicrobiales bacterium]
MSAVRVRLTFPENLIKEPVIARVVKEFDVMPNIRRAKVEDSYGWIVCELGGSHDSIESAIAWMRQLGVEVDLLGDVVEG